MRNRINMKEDSPSFHSNPFALRPLRFFFFDISQLGLGVKSMPGLQSFVNRPLVDPKQK